MLALEKTLEINDERHPEDNMSGALQHCMTKLMPYASKLLKHRYVKGKTGQALADALGRNLMLLSHR